MFRVKYEIDNLQYKWQNDEKEEKFRKGNIDINEEMNYENYFVNNDYWGKESAYFQKKQIKD